MQIIRMIGNIIFLSTSSMGHHFVTTSTDIQHERFRRPRREYGGYGYFLGTTQQNNMNILQ